MLKAKVLQYLKVCFKGFCQQVWAYSFLGGGLFLLMKCKSSMLVEIHTGNFIERCFMELNINNRFLIYYCKLFTEVKRNKGQT